MSDESPIPQLPEQAILEVEKWRARDSSIAFSSILQATHNSNCDNCQDLGFVYVSYSELGPFEVPPNTKRPVAWVHNGSMPGWYIIHETRAYRCPGCDQGKQFKEKRVPSWWKD